MPIYEINPHLVKISKQKNVSVDFVNALKKEDTSFFNSFFLLKQQ